MTPAWLTQAAIAAIPPTPTGTVCDWGAEHVRLPSSARSGQFRPSITPWVIEPTNCADLNGSVRSMVFVKPVQSGGSTCGEVALCYWIEHATSGDIAYYWPNHEKADDRWEKRIEKILRATRPVAARIPEDNTRCKKGKVIFPHLNFVMLGAYNQSEVESDSYRFEVCEELHDNHNQKGWIPGRLEQAEGRTTAFWNSIMFAISNASCKGDQLHRAYEAGTRQQWEVKCPGCGQYHAMFTRAEKGKRGGLRYDSNGCKRPDGTYDYNKLEKTIRYEFPCCGYLMADSVTERRALSLTGRYGKPQNAGAHLSRRSYTLEAVSVDYISWLFLIQKKHEALRALKYGDPGPWVQYLKERECRFWDPEERPLVGKVTVTSLLQKNRSGLRKHPNFFNRYFAGDRQRGTLTKGEVPHWWLVIRDALSTGDSQLVYEGKILTIEDLIACLKEHECLMRCGVLDSGWDTTTVYQVCMQHGINAIKGEDKDLFSHGEKGKKIFSPEKPLHQMINAPSKYEYEQIGEDLVPHPDEPLFWHYSKAGIRDRLAWLRVGGQVKFEIPEDVSEDYRRHMEAEEQETIIVPRTGERQTIWRQHHERNDLYVDECYIAMLMEMAGLIGEGVLKR